MNQVLGYPDGFWYKVLRAVWRVEAVALRRAAPGHRLGTDVVWAPKR